MVETKEKLLQQLKTVPDKPGVYVFKDSQGKVLYVGKGRLLKKRMRSYFKKNHPYSLKTELLVEKIEDFDFLVTSSEMEALILECNLIKSYKPSFNVNLRDDKSYPSMAITLADDFPRVMVTRKLGLKGARYFGPYTNPRAIRTTLDSLRRVFPIRSCRGRVPGKQGSTPCLNYHIERCLGPCAGNVDKEEYGQMIRQICLFLEGKQEKVISQLEKEMKEAAQRMEFEKAAHLRNRIQAATHVAEKQQVISENKEDRDVIGQFADEESICFTVFFIRGGKLIGSENFIFDRTEQSEDMDLLSSFVKQFYLRATYIPKAIVLPDSIEDQETIAGWLTKRAAKKVAIGVPKRGEKRRLLELANKNAHAALELLKLRSDFLKERALKGLAELKDQLQLPAIPYRIEAFDISTIQGKAAVGSMVVFENGRPENQNYRRFKIKSVKGQDDYAMMKEVVKRRFAKYKDGQEITKNNFGMKPDLVVVDGGKPQLSAALSALQELHIKDIPVIALAKREEDIFLPGKSQPSSLPRSSVALRLMQAIRDEAHRFALRYHQNLRNKESIGSALDEVPGIGEKRKRILIRHFGSPKAIFKATKQELLEVPNIPQNVSFALYDYMHSPSKN